ncbi:MAG: Rpn family recombination-promoting nuclease/putative transposase [Caldilineaceae bacterium]|nr:Rpn family recombination-promoting nuclease/putative transposase [Caldilineaceae bacterium]
MSNEPVNPHDAYFKGHLSDPHAAADFLRQHLPATVLLQLDLTQLVCCCATLVAPASSWRKMKSHRNWPSCYPEKEGYSCKQWLKNGLKKVR